MYLTRDAASFACIYAVAYFEKEKIAEAPVRHRSILALIYSGPRRTPHTPQGRQYFRVWLGHQFVIKSTPPTVAVPDGTGPRVIILNRAAPGPSISFSLRDIRCARCGDLRCTGCRGRNRCLDQARRIIWHTRQVFLKINSAIN